MEGCVLRYCMTLRRTERLETVEPQFIKSLVASEREQLQVQRLGMGARADGDRGTNMIYKLEMEPDFRVPPVIGPWYLKRTLSQGGVRAVMRIERLARELDGLPLGPEIPFGAAGIEEPQARTRARRSPSPRSRRRSPAPARLVRRARSARLAVAARPHRLLRLGVGSDAQQTQVVTVIPFYVRFMRAFPTVAALAAAPLDDVLGHWSGLGYYARGAILWRRARRREQHGGRLPETFDALLALPGIGRSTAGAILAQALRAPAPILDGNVKRVLARYHAVDGWPGDAAVQDALWEHAGAHTPNERVADYTQAIMDLGATLCTRARPACTVCPLATDVRGVPRRHAGASIRRRGRSARARTGSVTVLVVEDPDGRVAARAPAGTRSLGRALQPARARRADRGGVVRARARRGRRGRARASDDRARPSRTSISISSRGCCGSRTRRR
jgi:A/G-specific adenine glycosylase